MTIDVVLLVLAILFIHWVADFVLQDEYVAKWKSSNDLVLAFHGAFYSIVWVWPMAYLLGPWGGIAFALFTCVCHTITDFFTSRLNKQLWEEKKVHWFFVSVGFDQFLHFAQLFTTYYILNQHFNNGGL